MGQKRFEPTEDQRRQVETLSGYGMTQDQTATILGVDPKTLRKHFAAELKMGDARATAKVAQTLFQTAVSGSGKEAVTAAIFWMKVRAGWSERVQVDANVTNTGPAVEIYLPSNGRDPGKG